MIVFGAIDFAGALVGIGKFLGYRVTVCDARPAFATRARFPEADEIVVEWPHVHLDRAATDNRTVLCVLTHDPKFDVPLLRRALRLPAAYVGAMGSRRTHLDRVERLREAGATERELARLRSPIGLDLGARTPEETALSIAAEIVAVGRGGRGRRLRGPSARSTTTPLGGRSTGRRRSDTAEWHGAKACGPPSDSKSRARSREQTASPAPRQGPRDSHHRRHQVCATMR